MAAAGQTIQAGTEQLEPSAAGLGLSAAGVRTISFEMSPGKYR